MTVPKDNNNTVDEYSQTTTYFGFVRWDSHTLLYCHLWSSFSGRRRMMV